jgi:hypothetical protein
MLDWPDWFFGDAFAHLNPTGAAIYSAGFGACLRGRLQGQGLGGDGFAGQAPGCDIGWFRGEMAAAQAP